MVALLNSPIDSLAGGDEDNEYKKMLMAQLQQQQDMPQNSGPSQNQLIASLSGAANQLGTISGRTAQSPEVQKYADILDKNKALGEQQKMAQLNKQQSILAELAKMRDQTKMKASDLAFQDKKQKENRDFEDKKQKALFAQQKELENLKGAKALEVAEAKAKLGPTGGKPTESQLTSAYHASRMVASNKNIEDVIKSGYDPTTYSAAARKIDLPFVGKIGAKPEDRSYEQAAREFIASILRKETGASVTPKEYTDYSKIYIPEPGDDPQTLAQKSDARQRATESMIAISGNAYDPSKEFSTYSYKPSPQEGSAYAASPKGPKAGDVEDGYRFKGGNPSDPASWEEVK